MNEETRLVAKPENAHLLTVRGSVNRDPRQHTVTAAFVVKADRESLSNIQGADDAADARWYDLDKVFEWADFKHPYKLPAGDPNEATQPPDCLDVT